MLRNNYKMANASGCYPVAKSLSRSPSVAVLRGDLGGPCPPDFLLPSSFLLNFTFEFV